MPVLTAVPVCKAKSIPSKVASSLTIKRPVAKLTIAMDGLTEERCAKNLAPAPNECNFYLATELKTYAEDTVKADLVEQFLVNTRSEIESDVATAIGNLRGFDLSAPVAGASRSRSS